MKEKQQGNKPLKKKEIQFINLKNQKLQSLNLDNDKYKLTGKATKVDVSFNRLKSFVIEPKEYWTQISKYCVEWNGTGNDVKDVEHLGSLDKLQRLLLGSNMISSLPRGKWRKLKYLNIESNDIESLEPLKSCAELSNLQCSHNQLKNLTGLEMMEKLRILEASGNQIESLEGFWQNTTNWKSLKELYLSQNPLSKLHLDKSARRTLKVLQLDNCQFNSIDSIPSLPHLQELYMERNKIQQVSSKIHSKFPKLEILQLRNNNISKLQDLQPLSGCDRLTVVHLNGNPCCSESGYRGFILQLLPGKLSILDGEVLPGETVTLTEEEKKFIDEFELDLSLPLEVLEQKIRESDGKKIEKELVPIPILENTEQLMKKIDPLSNYGRQSGQSVSDKPVDMLSRDESKEIYEDCKNASEKIEKLFHELSEFVTQKNEDTLDREDDIEYEMCKRKKLPSFEMNATKNRPQSVPKTQYQPMIASLEDEITQDLQSVRDQHLNEKKENQPSDISLNTRRKKSSSEVNLHELRKTKKTFKKFKVPSRLKPIDHNRMI